MNTKCIFDHRIPSGIEHLVESAQSRLILVTPYWSWPNFTRRIVTRVKKGVSVTVILREDQQDEEYYYRLSADLTNAGVSVIRVAGLHAKIVLNDSAVIIGSMNLLATSGASNHEAAIFSNDPMIIGDMQRYIGTLTELGSKFKVSITDKVIGAVMSILPEPPGHCIECNVKIEFYPRQPFCHNHIHLVTAGTKPKHFSFCHDCGQKHSTTLLKPLCYQCFLRNQSTGLD